MRCHIENTALPNSEKTFVWRFLVPGISLIALLFAMAFFIILPLMQSHLEQRKREDTKAVVSIAWTVLENFHKKELAGELTRQEAQTRAKDVLRAMRYGQDLNDYIWINDMDNTMIMHPYITEIVGKNVNDMTDSKGKLLFVEFLQTVTSKKQGHVVYHWPLYDNENIIKKKISFVKAFKPWDWYIGSGVYLDVARNKTIMFMGSRSWAFLILLLMATVLGIYMIVQGKNFARLHMKYSKSIKDFFEQMPNIVFCLNESGCLCWHNEKATVFCDIEDGPDQGCQKFSTMCLWDEQESRDKLTHTLETLKANGQEQASLDFTAILTTTNKQKVRTQCTVFKRVCPATNTHIYTLVCKTTE